MELGDISRRGFVGAGSVLVGGLAAGPSLVGLSGCRPPVGPAGPAAAEPASAVAEPPGPEAGSLEAEPPPEPTPDPRAGYETRLDLVEHLHLADVDHHGLFVDFGTAAQHKHTLGGWRSGWAEDEHDGALSCSWAGESPARLYFHLDRPGPLRLVLRARPGRADRISVYVNDRPVDRIVLPAGWSEQTVRVEAGMTRAGENGLKLVHSGGAGATRSFAVDWLRVAPEGAEARGPFAAPTAAALVRAASASGAQAAALRLRAPTRLSWFLEVPEGCGLGFAASAEGRPSVLAATATDGVTGAVSPLLERRLEPGEAPRPELLDLASYGGRIARIDLEVRAEPGDEGEGGTVNVEAPALLARPVRVELSSPPRARHVVVVVVDTLRADRLAVHDSSSRVQTPRADRLSAEAATFERCQAPGNWTKPSCASLLTGLHPPSHRALTASGVLPRSVPFFPEIFQAAGVRTGAFIANGYLAADFGFDRGWHRYRNYIRERRPTEAEHVYREVLGWMEANRSERMLVYVQTIDPHVPYDPPDEDLRRYDPAPYSGPVRNRSTGHLLEDFKRGRVELSARDRARLEALYDGEVTYHDRCFGGFLDRLDELGLADETLLVVTSDHGEEFFEHDSVGHGHSLYQELLHVPLLMRLPGLTRPGQRLGAACTLVDLAPTVLAAAGLPLPDSLEGRSLLPELLGAPAPPLTAAFSSQWDTGNDRELGWTARMGDFKLRMRGPAQSFLADLAADPWERRDLDERLPIALRATRIALGQFLGNSCRASWAAAPRPGGGRRAPEPARQEAAMTPELCAQLRALGYLDIAACGD